MKKSPSTPLEGLLDIEDMMSKLKRTRNAIRCAVNRRRADLIPLPMIICRRYYWRPQDVEAWIDAQASVTPVALKRGRGRPRKGEGRVQA